MQKFVEFYLGSVAPDRLAFKIPSENRANVEAQLLKEKRLDKYIIIDPEEQERFRLQQEALKAKLSSLNTCPPPATISVPTVIDIQPVEVTGQPVNKPVEKTEPRKPGRPKRNK